MSGINVMNKGLEISSKASQKQSERTSSHFASMLNKEVQQKTNGNQKQPDQELKSVEENQVFVPFSAETNSVDRVASVEKLMEAVEQLIATGELPDELTVEMLNQDTSSLLTILPEELVKKLQALFESGTSLQELMGASENIPLENLLAGLIYTHQQTKDVKLDVSSKDALLTFFQQVNAQLHKLTQDGQASNQVFSNQPKVTEELQQFLSSIHTKLTGKNPLATDESQKMNYLRLLFQRTVHREESVKSNVLQDTNPKGLGMGVEPQTNLNRAQQFALFIEQGGTKAANQEQFIKEFQSILAKTSLQNVNGGMKLLIKLYPEHLGQLRVELLQQNGVLTARMVATTAAAKEMLESQLQGLKNAFAGQNIQVEKLEIINSQTLQQEFDRSLNKDGRQQGNESSSSKEDKQNDQQNEATFEETLHEELMNIEV
ncbi:flagellar hook-length control protein FliK [Bacillus mesophilus]|nr:flagellar hook-length control protein FliK [Bacillus mesophilus]